MSDFTSRRHFVNIVPLANTILQIDLDNKLIGKIIQSFLHINICPIMYMQGG